MSKLSPKRKVKYRLNHESLSNLKGVSGGQTTDFTDFDYSILGELFISAIEKYGCNERGEPIKMTQWFRQYLLLVADLRADVYISGCSQLGKAQPLDAKILTPSGWKCMGDIKADDLIIAGDGSPSRVLAVYPQGEKEIFQITLDDETTTECCKEHLWLSQTYEDRRVNNKNTELKTKGKRQREWTPLADGTRPGKVKPLAEIMSSLLVLDKSGKPRVTRGESTKSNHNIPVVSPVQFDGQELPLDPYLIGALIGDGSLSINDRVGFSTADAEILEQVTLALPDNNHIRKLSDYDYSILSKARDYGNKIHDSHPVLHRLRGLGLMGSKSYDKFIPDCYKFSSIESRIALVQGLLDTDGYVSVEGTIQFGTSSKQLIYDFRELILSLGGVVGGIKSRIPTYTYKGEKRTGALAYSLTIRLPENIEPFRLLRKLKRCSRRDPRNHRRYIRKVEPIGLKECQCILIDHPSHLYVTDNYIVTHNTLGTTLFLCFCLTELGLNTLWSYDLDRSLQIQVKSNFRPVIEGWLKRKGLRPSSSDSQNNTLYQVQNVTAQFVYVSTSKPGGNSMGAAAGGTTVGVSRDILFKEERSQYPVGASDPLHRRLDAGRVPTRPIRELGTPGAGAGIEAEIKKCERQFYPHYQCPECGAIAPLHPKGCLLKEVEVTRDGKPVKLFLSEYGRPIEWHHHDESDPINTAYIGCSACGAEIPTADISDKTWFQCQKSGQLLKDFLQSLPKKLSNKKWSCGIVISPLLRTQVGTASRIIGEGLNTSNTADWQQQSLGEESTTSANLLFNLDYFRRCATGQWMPPQPDHKYLLCIDPNFGGSDFYVCEVWDITQMPYSLVQQYRRRNMTTTYSEGKVVETIDQYKPLIAVVEDNSGGAIVLENLIKARPNQRFETVTTSGKNKLVNTDRIALALERMEVIFPPNWEAASEWTDDTGKICPSEASQFSRVDRKAIAGNDDTITCWSAGWAWLEEARKMIGGEFVGELGTVEPFTNSRARFRR